MLHEPRVFSLVTFFFATKKKVTSTGFLSTNALPNEALIADLPLWRLSINLIFLVGVNELPAVIYRRTLQQRRGGEQRGVHVL